jgi:hypothetical protein
MAKTYPRIGVNASKMKQVKESDVKKGETITVPGQAMSLKDIIKRSISGFPVPMAREELVLHPDLNQVLQGTSMDIVSDAKFKTMSKVERQQYLNNLGGLKSQLANKVQQAKDQKQAVHNQMETQESLTQQAQTEAK